MQSLESRVYRLAGVVEEDLEKAKLLLESADEDVPMQIHQDLVSTYQEVETNVSAAMQMSTARSYSLNQAMETGKVSVRQQ